MRESEAFVVSPVHLWRVWKHATRSLRGCAISDYVENSAFLEKDGYGENGGFHLKSRSLAGRFFKTPARLLTALQEGE